MKLVLVNQFLPKPVFILEVNESTTLADMFGPDSWYTIQVLQVNTRFFSQDVE